MRVYRAPDGVNAWFWCRVLGHQRPALAMLDRSIVYVCPRCGAEA